MRESRMRDSRNRLDALLSDMPIDPLRRLGDLVEARWRACSYREVRADASP
jgi:hypothetical protein